MKQRFGVGTWTVLVATVWMACQMNVSDAAVVIRWTQSGGNVVITTSGSADTTQWGPKVGSISNVKQVGLNSGGVDSTAFGVASQDIWSNAGAAGSFMFTDHGLAGVSYVNFTGTLTSGGGDVGFRNNGTLIWLPTGYTSLTAINQVLTIPGATFASIGVVDGQWSTISWGGTNPDRISVAIGTAVITPVELQSFEVE